MPRFLFGLMFFLFASFANAQSTRVPSYANNFGWTQIPTGPYFFQFTAAQFPGMGAFAGITCHASYGSVWFSISNTTAPYTSQIVRLDQDTWAVQAVIPSGSLISIIAAAPGGKLWASDLGANKVYRIDVATNAIDLTVTGFSSPRGVSYGAGKVLIANQTGNTVTMLDPTTGAVLATIPVGSGPYYTDFDGVNFWVANAFSNNVSVINPTSMTVIQTISTASTPIIPFSDGSKVYVVTDSTMLTVIDQKTFDVAMTWVLPTGAGGHFPVKVRDQLWLTMHGRNSMGVFNENGTLDKEIGLGQNPSGACYTEHGDVDTIDYNNWTVRRHQAEHRIN